MEQAIHKLQGLLTSGSDTIANCSQSELIDKTSPKKWSKIELLGHLVDSALNNLQRFTEIQFAEKPYQVRKYNQDELVKANNYQQANPVELTKLWLSLNRRIMAVMEYQTEHTLSYTIEIDAGELSNLRFLMTDYVDHLEHHLKQMAIDI